MCGSFPHLLEVNNFRERGGQDLSFTPPNVCRSGSTECVHELVHNGQQSLSWLRIPRIHTRSANIVFGGIPPTVGFPNINTATAFFFSFSSFFSIYLLLLSLNGNNNTQLPVQHDVPCSAFPFALAPVAPSD